MELAVEDDTGRDAGPDGEIGEVVGRAVDDIAVGWSVAAARTSFSMTTGSPSVASSPSRRAKSCQPRLTASVTWPRFGCAPRDADADRHEVFPPEGGATEGLVQACGDGRNGAALVTHGGGVGSATEDGAICVDDRRPAILVPPMSIPATGPGRLPLNSSRFTAALIDAP